MSLSKAADRPRFFYDRNMLGECYHEKSFELVHRCFSIVRREPALNDQRITYYNDHMVEGPQSFLTPINGKKSRASKPTQDAGDKYLGCIFNLLISRYITEFLVFYTPRGGTELSDRNFGVRYSS